MKLRDILKESEDRGLTNEVKKHFLEIVSTYNKYQESMDRKSDIIEVVKLWVVLQNFKRITLERNLMIGLINIL